MALTTKRAAIGPVDGTEAMAAGINAIMILLVEAITAAGIAGIVARMAVGIMVMGVARVAAEHDGN